MVVPDPFRPRPKIWTRDQKWKMECRRGSYAGGWRNAGFVKKREG